MLGRSQVIAIAVAVAALGVAAPLTAGPPKAHLALAQLSGTAGCLADPAGEGSADGCAKGKALNSATNIALTPDGANAYVTTDNSLVTVARDKSTGELSEPGCVSNDTGDGRVGTNGICSDGDALRGGKDVAVSPDGAWVYATALISSSLGVFARDSKGTLRQSACVQEFVVAGHCQDVVGIEGARGLTVSPDGKSVYVLGGVDPYRETSRNAGTIALFKPDGSGGVQQTQCVSDDGSNGACVLAPGLSMPFGADISPDGKNLYVVGAESLLTFERNTTTGTLTPAGCMLENPPGGGPCRDMPPVFFAHDVAVSPDGRSVYTAGVDGIREFSRKDDGSLASIGCLVEKRTDQGGQEPEEARVRASASACTQIPGLYEADSLAVGDKVVYVTTGDQVLALSRDNTGELTFSSCVESTDPDQPVAECDKASNLHDATGVATSADGQTIMVTSFEAGAVTVFKPGASAEGTRASVRSGYATVTVGCSPARTRPCRGSLRLAAGAGRAGEAASARRAFSIRPGQSAALRVRVSAEAVKALQLHRRVRVTALVGDKSNRTRAVGHRLVLVG